MLSQTSFITDALSDICPEVVDKVHAKMERRSSDGDNCSMEYNPTYGDPFIDGLKQDKSTNNYHILKFEHKPACKQEQQLQLAINGDSNCYHTLQYLDHMPKCDYESEYCDLADISNYINADGVPKPEERSDSCFVTTLEQATMKSGADMAEIENEYDHLNAGHSCVEHCDVIVLKPNHCYNSVKMKSHVWVCYFYHSWLLMLDGVILWGRQTDNKVWGGAKHKYKHEREGHISSLSFCMTIISIPLLITISGTHQLLYIVIKLVSFINCYGH